MTLPRHRRIVSYFHVVPGNKPKARQVLNYQTTSLDHTERPHVLKHIEARHYFHNREQRKALGIERCLVNTGAVRWKSYNRNTTMFDNSQQGISK